MESVTPAGVICTHGIAELYLTYLHTSRLIPAVIQGSESPHWIRTFLYRVWNVIAPEHEDGSQRGGKSKILSHKVGWKDIQMIHLVDGEVNISLPLFDFSPPIILIRIPSFNHPISI